MYPAGNTTYSNSPPMWVLEIHSLHFGNVHYILFFDIVTIALFSIASLSYAFQ